MSDLAMQILPTGTFTFCPDEVDVLGVLDSAGTAARLVDREVLDFLVVRVATDRHATSVCTDSLVPAAGLMTRWRARVHFVRPDDGKANDHRLATCCGGASGYTAAQLTPVPDGRRRRWFTVDRPTSRT